MPNNKAITHNNVVFPGENWFFYWKTSTSLWESKLREYNGINPIFTPIHWAFHEMGEGYDFGQHRPETNLQKLSEIAHNCGKELIFLIPLSPAPFLPNGGIPSNLSQSLSVSKDGITYAIMDNCQQIHKLYSHYDPNIYKLFRKFIWNLGQFFSQSGIRSSIFGMRCGYTKNGQFHTYMEDRSPCYEHGLSRFISKQKSSGDYNPEKDQLTHFEFSKLINELYIQSSNECLAANWEGVLDFSFLGGAPDDIFRRSNEQWEHHSFYFQTIFDSITLNVIPTSILLPDHVKAGLLNQTINDIITPSYLKNNLKQDLFNDGYMSSFSPLQFYSLFVNPIDLALGKNPWKSNGLTNYLFAKYKWAFSYNTSIPQGDADETDLTKKVFFFSGEHLSKQDFNSILQLFMNGAKICLDRSNLDEKLSRRLDLFFSENALHIEKVNYYTQIESTTLGEGSLVIFKGEEVSKLGPIKIASFWESIIGLLEIKHMSIDSDDDLFFFWKLRSPKTVELDFEEIRRICIYNPTSYRKKSRISANKNFALLKFNNDQDSKIKSTPTGIDIELLPNSSVSLDFGFFE